ncbi:nucleotide disphospho-sugar-binding domain-containing protein [Tessaracoccus sp. G1721]
MARILMAGVPAYGLATPSLPFARALVDAGHEVHYIMGEAFRRRVEASGATLVPFGPPEAITHPRQLALQGRRLFHALQASIRRLAPGYDAVVAAGLNPEIPALERDLDCPVIFLSPVFFQNDRVISHLAGISTSIPSPARRALASPAARRVLAAVVGPVVLGSRPRDILDMLRPLSSTLNISPATRYYQPHAEDFDDLPCYFAGPTATASMPDDAFPLDRLRAHGGPVVYATLGTVFNRNTGYFRAIIEAFAGSDALVVVTTGRTESLPELGDLPDNVIARSFVPQADVLREADLCFTHGGFGSTTDTVLAGVPAVFTPMGADQFFNAHRMQELDAGRVLPSAQVTPESVRRVADSLLSGGAPAGLAPLRASFEEAPGPAGAVAEIEKVLAGS